MSYLTVAYGLVAVLVAVVIVSRLRLRLQLSLAKHRSLAGHSRMARRVASLVPFYEYDEDRFFRADDAPQDIAGARRQAFMRLSEEFKRRFAVTAARTAELEGSVSD